MKGNFKRITFLLLLLVITLVFFSLTEKKLPEKLKESALSAQNDFQNAILHKNKIIIIDYRLPVFMKRLWLYDCEEQKVLINCHVSHAIKSGFIFAKRFSNEPGTHLSCAGSFLTQEDYYGQYGYSMRIQGLESSNNNARGRAIVFHPMVSFRIWGIKLPSGMAFYSLGCFALKEDKLAEIIQQTKNGSLVHVKI